MGPQSHILSKADYILYPVISMNSLDSNQLLGALQDTGLRGLGV